MLSLSTLYIYIYIYAWLRLIRISIWCLIKDLATGFTLWHVVSQHSSATSITMEFWTQFMDKGAPGTNVYTESEDAETHSLDSRKKNFKGQLPLTVCVQHLLILFVSHKFHHVSLFFQWPAATSCSYSSRSHFPTWIWWMPKSCTCIMSQPSFESAVVFEVWSSTYLISNWEHFRHGLCAAFSPSSLESELELGEGYKPVTTAIQNSSMQEWCYKEMSGLGQAGTIEWKEPKDHTVAYCMGRIIVYSRHYKLAHQCLKDATNARSLFFAAVTGVIPPTPRMSRRQIEFRFWWELLMFWFWVIFIIVHLKT